MSFVKKETVALKSWNVRNLTTIHIKIKKILIKTFLKVGPDEWGTIYQNDTADGAFGPLYTKEVEFAIGCIYAWYADIFEMTHVIARSTVILLVPSAV